MGEVKDVGRLASSGDRAGAPSESSPVPGLEQSRSSHGAIDGEILSPRSTDPEVSALLDELSNLQTWCTLQMRSDRQAVAAADLVQRTRILIIERCKR